jgi:hypothetical protein
MDVLSELEDLGALGEPAAPVQRVEEVKMEAGSPSAPMRDQRGPVMTEQLDRALGGLDRLASALETASTAIQDLKGVLTEMKQIWEPPVIEDDYDPARQEEDDGEVPEAP